MNLPDQKARKKGSEIICLCNNVTRETIEAAIVGGVATLNEIFDLTTAGVGPCGGSCRRKLGPMLDHYLETKTLLPAPERQEKKKRS
jgi:bacterioferritin-associated ferredoxin